MAGGALGGRYGVVNGLTGIRNWQLNDDGTLAVFANSATAAGQGRLPGITAWTGGYSNHGALPPVLPGVLFGFQGFTAPDNGILGGVGYKYSGNAMVDSVSINWDWQGGNVIGVSSIGISTRWVALTLMASECVPSVWRPCLSV